MRAEHCRSSEKIVSRVSKSSSVLWVVGWWVVEGGRTIR